jgi:hypothetical protein
VIARYDNVQSNYPSVNTLFQLQVTHMNLKAIIAIPLLLTLLACSRLTLGNYSKITVGMSYEDVTALIGPPAKCNDVMGIRNCSWGDANRSINVSFVGGKVLLFASNNLR